MRQLKLPLEIENLPELAFLILGTYFTAPFLFYDAQLIKSAMYVTTPRPA